MVGSRPKSRCCRIICNAVEDIIRVGLHLLRPETMRAIACSQAEVFRKEENIRCISGPVRNSTQYLLKIALQLAVYLGPIRVYLSFV